MNLHIEPIKDVKKIQQHLNEVKLIELIQDLTKRVEELEQQKGKGSSLKSNRFPSRTQLILQSMEDGKIHSMHGVLEELREKYPEVKFSSTSIYAQFSALCHEKKIVRVGAGAYRIVK